MKNINEEMISDKEIVELIDKQKNYEIKLSSDEILNKYYLEQQTIDKTLVKKARFNAWKFILPSFACCFLAFGITFGVLYSMDQSGTSSGNNIVNVVEKNEKYKQVISDELLTFTNFNNNDLRQTNNIKNIYNRQSIKEKFDDQQTLTYEQFNEVVDEYEKLENGVYNIFNINNYQIEVEQGNYEFLNEKFDFKMNVFNDDINIEYFYNQDEVIDIDDDEKEEEIVLNGYYSFTNLDNTKTIYKARFSNKTETEENEVENEIEAVFYDYNNDETKPVYEIKKEQETENLEVEEAYSYSIYNSIEDYKRQRVYYSIEYEIENVNNEKELEIKVTNIEKEIEFKNIRQIDETHFSFEFEYESDRVESSATAYIEYINEKRIYTCNNLTIEK